MTARAVAAALLGLTWALPAAPAAAETIRAAFRVFDGTQEVSAETRIALRVSGSETETVVLDEMPLAADVTPGIYDAQAIRHRAGRVLTVRWAERLVIVKYPDEGHEHLEVINLTSGYGALQLVLPKGVRPDPAALTVTSADGKPSTARVLPGGGYLLVVAPAGTYNLTLTLPAGPELLTDVEIPADRTRMRLVGGEPPR